MSYRKLEVNGQVFEYSIGKTHTKIRGIGAFKNEDVGNNNVNGNQQWWDCPDGSFQVRPSDLASFIKQKKLSINERK
jgi:hypothetical protein